MNKPTLWGRIAGRINKMKEYFLSWGNIYVPIGVVLIIFSLERHDLLWGIMGILCFAVGGLSMRLALKKAKNEDDENRIMFKILIQKIDNLTNAIKQDRDERKDKSNKPTL
jgi:hypothetical protein